MCPCVCPAGKVEERLSLLTSPDVVAIHSRDLLASSRAEGGKPEPPPSLAKLHSKAVEAIEVVNAASLSFVHTPR